MAQLGWSKRLDETGDQVAALEAAVRETLARDLAWLLNDAIRYAVSLLLPLRRRDQFVNFGRHVIPGCKKMSEFAFYTES